MAETIRTSATRGDLVRFIRAIPKLIVGKAPDPDGVGAQMRSLIAFRFFDLVTVNLDKLSTGEAGVDGTQWPPLSKKYLAYGRPVKGFQYPDGRNRPRAGGKWPGGKDGMLTETQLKTWKKAFVRNLKWLILRHDEAEAKSIAAAMATNQVKKQGAKFKISDPGFGGRQVGTDYQTLKSNGTLFASLQPGEVKTQAYAPKTPDQIAEMPTGEVVVGTRAPHAATHHEGRGKVPERRLWPKELPPEWSRDIGNELRGGVRDIINIIKRGGKL